MSLSLISLNARGLRNNLKRKAIFLFAKQHKTDLCFLQETHSISEDVPFWKSQWGNDIFCSHASQRSAGVCTLKNLFAGKLPYSDFDSNGHYVCHVVQTHTSNFIVINIYGYNLKVENDALLDRIEERIVHWLAKFPNAHILLGGDFNITLDNMIDRWPPGHSSNTNAKLKLLMQRFDLIDAWRTKHPHDVTFTWCNNSRSKQSRIDLWLVSRVLIDNLSTNILSTPLTDHKAIQININLLPTNYAKLYNSYWKLNSSVLKHEAVILEVKKCIYLFWSRAKVERVYGKHWELLKFKLGKFFRNYCSNATKLKRAQEEDIISTIACLSSRRK